MPSSPAPSSPSTPPRNPVPDGPDVRQWHHFLTRTGTLAAALLFGSGLVFFFAFNWDALGRFWQMGLGAGALTLAALATCLTRPGSAAWRAGCLLVALATGALLALIGQKYQTGADIWQLFASWAALTLPVALLARSGAVWLLWLLVVNLALTRGLQLSELWLWQRGPTSAALLLAACNGLLLVLLRRYGRQLLAHPAPWLQQVLWLAVLLSLALATMSSHGWTMPAYAGIAALSWLQARRSHDSVLLAMVYATALAVACYLLIDWLDLVDIGGGLLMLAALILGGSALGLRDVLQLWRTEHAGPVGTRSPATVPASQPVARTAAGSGDDGDTPWWINALMGSAAWLAAMPLLLGIALLIPAALEWPICLLGLVLVVLGLTLMRDGGVFRRQLGFVLSISGQSWLAIGLLELMGLRWSTSLLLPALLAALASLPRSTLTHRTLCLVIAMGFFGMWACADAPPQPPWLVPGLFAASLAGWACGPTHQPGDRTRWRFAARQAVTVCALAAAVLVLPFNALPPFGGTPLSELPAVALSLSHLLAVALWLLTLVWLWRAAPQARTHWIWLVALATSVLAWPMPHLLLATALALVLFQLRQTVWLALTLLVAVALVGMYYHDLQTSLLHKSISLMAAGLLTAALLWLAQRHSAAAPTPTLRQGDLP